MLTTAGPPVDLPEEQPGLAQLKPGQVVFLHQGHTKDIGCRKEPAAPAVSLIGDGCALEGNLDVEDLLVGDLDRPGGQDLLRIRGGKRR